MKRLLLLCYISSLTWSCGEENQEVQYQDLVYHSLIAEQDTLSPGESTKIKATATGSDLSYFWSATRGDLLGSGTEVIYASSPCHAGNNQITCKITNGSSQSESKTISIVVLEE